MAALAMLCRVAVSALSTICAAAPATAGEQIHLPSPKPICLSAADTREEVKSHKILEPFAALKSAAAQRKAEALSARLCHIGDDFFYEIILLHRDGRLVHVQMDADTGKLIARPARGQREAPPRETHEPSPREAREPVPPQAAPQ